MRKMGTGAVMGRGERETLTVTRVAGIALVAIAAAIAVYLVTATAAPSSGTAPSPQAAQPSSTANGTPARLRVVHSPGQLTDDMGLRPGQCRVLAVDATTGTYLPDPACTPGAVDPAVMQATIGSTICRHGYTATVRPSESVTGPAKRASLAAYSLPYAKTTEYDHLVSLELGGANSTSNLWPEPNKFAARTTTNPKDSVENVLNAAVCDHQVTLAAAQAAIATNWATAERTLGVHP